MEAGTSRNKLEWGIAAVAVAVSFYLMYFWVRYTIGYGSAPDTFFSELNRQWNGFEDWSHGRFVPLISIWLVWRDRKKLASIPVRGETWAILPLLFGLLVYWVGFKIDQMYLGYASFMILTASLIVWFLGLQMFWALFFPWAFLVFSWPLLFLDDSVAFHLRGVMTQVSYFFLKAIGLDVIREGTGIKSAANFAMGIPAGAKFQVDIANPCSGIRSLFALAMITCIYGYLNLRTWGGRLVLLVSAAPLAVAGNFFRILMLTFGTLWFGADFAIGTIDHPSNYHMSAGFVVFAVALVAMVALTKLLKQAEGRFAPQKAGES